jgi:hypothetical protein
MFQLHTVGRRVGIVAVALAVLVGPVAASAVAASAQDIPSYARPVYVSTDETVHGRIRSVDGAFNISVDDDRGFVDNVQLHQGTIINPTGLSLSPGMTVTILGVTAGSTFNANEIDTPYDYAGPLPTPVYYGAGYWCPGFAYGYGPSFSLAFVFGGGRSGFFEHRPFYGRPWNGHGYFGGYVGRGPVDRGRIEVRHEFNSTTVRATTSVRADVRTETSHAPAAFAGRSFAGETRTYGNHVTAESGYRPTGESSYRTTSESQYRASRESGYHAESVPSGAYGRSGGASRGGGGEASRGGGGASRGGGGASHGGGGGGGHSH